MQDQRRGKDAKLAVLIVEDNYLLSRELCSFIRELGHRPLGPVGTLASGLAILGESCPPDCAVVDLDLDGELAFPLARRLQELGVALVFATGYNRAIAEEGGFDAVYLGKPFERGEFVHALERALARPKAPIQPESMVRQDRMSDPLSDVIRFSRELRMVSQIIGRRTAQTE